LADDAKWAEARWRSPRRQAMTPPEEIRAAVERLEALAKIMDSALAIPGTNIRFGLDAVIGLVPGVGDLIAGAISTYLIWEAKRLGASRWLVMRMLANTTIDTVIGSIPIVGDAFDVLFRANRMNMALLRAHLERTGALKPVIEGVARRV
jgi:hypothetical protein